MGHPRGRSPETKLNGLNWSSPGRFLALFGSLLVPYRVAVREECGRDSERRSVPATWRNRAKGLRTVSFDGFASRPATILGCHTEE